MITMVDVTDLIATAVIKCSDFRLIFEALKKAPKSGVNGCQMREKAFADAKFYKIFSYFWVF